MQYFWSGSKLYETTQLILVEALSKKGTKKGVLTELTIEFTDVRSFIFHFSKAIDFTNSSAKHYTTKKICDCNIRVTASGECPIIFHFHVRHSKVTLTLHYEVKNRYG